MYAISDAIDKFTKKYKELVSERNQIEKDKLKFEKEKFTLEKEKFELEKEKFEFNKQQLELNESLRKENDSKKMNNEFECPHNWVFDAVYDIPYDFTRKERYVCSICGKEKWELIEYTFKT